LIDFGLLKDAICIA